MPARHQERSRYKAWNRRLKRRARSRQQRDGTDTWYQNVERVMGIEPTYAAWEATVLQLNYTRVSGLYYMHFAGERNHRLRIFCHKSSCSANY